MTKIRRAAAFLALLPTTALAVGCSSVGGGERTVFALDGGYSQGLRGVRPIDIVDLGVPNLYNVTDQTVHLRAIKLVSIPRTMHVRSVTAYVYPSSGSLGIGRGDLLRYCRKIDRPYPVTAVSARPRSYANWLIVIAFTIARPGRYQIEHAKISYTVNGKLGWQYQNLNTTIWGVSTPPGAKPRFDGCL